MVTRGKRFLSLLLLILGAAMPAGCSGTDEGSREAAPPKDVKVGGDHGVVVERSDPGTETKVGGDHGVVVERSGSGTEVKVGGSHGVVVERSDSGTKVKVGGDRGIVVEHPKDPAEDDRR